MKRFKLFPAFAACLVLAVSCFPEKTVPVTGLEVSPPSLNMKVGETATVTATVSPDNATDKTVNWTSTDPEMAVMAFTGNVVKAIAPGEATLIATTVDGGKTAICQIVVTAKEPSGPTDPTVHVTGVDLTPVTATAAVGETVTLVASVLPDDATDKSLEWNSSDESVATVSNGVVTALAPGKVSISAVSVDNPKAVGYSEIEVYQPTVHVAVTGITLSEPSITLKEGEYYTLTATVEPADATDPGIKWETSDDGFVTVSDDGQVYARAVGGATVTAISVDNPSITASCDVIVEPSTPPVIPVESITINTPLEISMLMGDPPFHIEVTVSPEDATDKTLMWESADPGVAEVDSDGNVTAINVGTTHIRISSVLNPEVFAECNVEVTPSWFPVTAIYLDHYSLELMEDDASVQITATVEPAYASDPSIHWASDNESVAIVADGVVTPVAPGNAKIVASSVSNPEIFAICEVTVTQKVIHVSDVTVSESSVSLRTGDVHALSCTVSPPDADDPSVTWTSADDSVVYVSETGELVALSEGTVIVTVTANDGLLSRSCTVEVTQANFRWTQIEGKQTYVYQFIDLGFQSKTWWCNQNLLARTPSDYGARFAWGDIRPDNFPYGWDNYKWGTASDNLTAYNWDPAYGKVDNRKTLRDDDDPVYYFSQGKFPTRTPTPAQFQELIDNTDQEIITVGGTRGLLFKSKKKARAVYIPFSGFCYGDARVLEGYDCRLWSNELSDIPHSAKGLFFGILKGFEINVTDVLPRIYGLPTRAVYNYKP
ncbi:MAG: Ig-like domain-containing protein [Bacteroidales bacterium]|nr:Ig-like domain-containing protein [Bacteroidales bacterium]